MIQVITQCHVDTQEYFHVYFFQFSMNALVFTPLI